MLDYKEFQNLLSWAKGNDNVRTLILTSSRANSKARRDILSDYDIEIYVRDLEPFLKDDSWFEIWGEVLVRWPLKPQSTQSDRWITRLVQYESCCRIDFQITRDPLSYHESLDAGYSVLLDKDNNSKKLSPPKEQQLWITKPTEDEFKDRVNSFLWDILYIPKSLLRDELFYSKFMSDSVIRFNCLQVFIEWYIAKDHQWTVGCNKYGRAFKDYLDVSLWKKIENTFTGPLLSQNWKALYRYLDIAEFLVSEVAQSLEYSYPKEQFDQVLHYIRGLEKLDLKNR